LAFASSSRESPRSSSTRVTITSILIAPRRKGLLFHGSGAIEGGWGIIDFWETREDFDAFAARIPEGLAAAGVQPQGPPDIKEFPVHEMIHP
jgi:hypothetical protein